MVKWYLNTKMSKALGSLARQTLPGHLESVRIDNRPCTCPQTTQQGRNRSRSLRPRLQEARLPRLRSTREEKNSSCTWLKLISIIKLLRVTSSKGL